MTHTKRRDYLQLFGEFIRFGCFTFGGGWSIIAQMQQLYVEKRKNLTSQELMDITSLAKSLPGVMICNVAILYGYRVGGLLGGLLCVLGMSAPPMGILILISFCYSAFRNSFWVAAAMEGMQAAVVPIIGSAAIGLVRGSFPYPPCILVALVCFAAYIFLPINLIYLVLIGIVSGLLIGDYYERKEVRTHGAS